MAAAAVMPKGTILYFNERANPPDAGPSRYDMRAAVQTCAGMADLGWTVRRVPCDVEHLRGPLGVPVDLSNAIPAVLMADADGRDAIGWGTIAESAYRIGSHGFVDYAQRGIYRSWRAIFASAGLDFLNAVAGVSEVGTASIIRTCPGGSLAQSCIRGEPGHPCEMCWKCIRKTLLDAGLSGDWPRSTWIERSLPAPEPLRYLLKIPIKHECVLTFAMSRYDGDAPALKALRSRVRGDRLDVTWLARYYAPSLDLIPERYRHEVRARLGRYLQPMTTADEAQFRSWSLEEVETSPEFARLSNEFGEAVRGRALVEP